MSRDASQYDDRSELAEYLWYHYFDLFSTSEKLAASTLLAEQKMASSEMSDTMRRVMQRTWVSHGNSDVDTLLAGGSKNFLILAATRIMKDFRDDVFVNRCPICNRIVATPRARQCLWCGHDWHEKPDPR